MTGNGNGNGSSNGNATAWSTYSYDIDDPNGSDYCAKTDVHQDGTVHRFSATNGSFKLGHGHAVHNRMAGYIKDEEKRYDRKPNDPRSIGRKWEER